MNIEIFSNDVAGGWHPDDVDKFLTANEETLVLWAEALVRAGHKVSVFASLRGDITGAFRNSVVYFPRHVFDVQAPHDAIITFKDRGPWLRGANAPIRLHWSMDIEQPWTVGLQSRVQKLLTLGPFHSSRMEWIMQEKRGRVPLGMDFSSEIQPSFTDKLFRRAAKRDNLAVYTTSPDRGLERLLMDWPRIKLMHPGLELKVTYDLGRLLTMSSGWQAYSQRLHALAQEAGAVFTGPLSKVDFQKLLARAQYYIHPLNRIESDLFGYGAFRAWHAGVLPVLNYYTGTAFADTVPEWTSYRDFLAGKIERQKEHPPMPVLSWDENVRRYWQPLLGVAA